MKKDGEEDDRDLSKLILADTASAIPPLSQQPPPMAEGRAASTSTSRKRTRTEAGQETERGRREKMSDMYALLQTMVPTLFPKATRVKIISETAEYIKELERRRDRLEEMKKSIGAVAATPILVSQCSNPDSSLRVTVSGNVAFFGIQSVRVRRGLATQIIMAFEKHEAQVFAANVAVNHGLLMVTVTAFVGNNRDDIIDKIIRDIRNL
ncbi:hypothetical protein PVL29_005776 [Vitis rotundifolia]|uniref:BHLH domain-containing protein n=1 Tax=Vitis rotundifolia TaxID=103349 RepID=A0AA39DW92_VITRO|nr:hypothetical protein PVL29_005776 [Vitis rotundifolia]